MTTYDLTDKQKQLIKLLVKNIKAKRISESIIPEINSEGCSIEGIDVKFERNFIWDMDALCDAELMECTYSRYSSQGNRIYNITRAGYQAVANNFIFVIPEELERAQADLETVPSEINIEKIQAMWFADLAEIPHILNNPHLLEKTVEALTDQLLEVIEPEISAYKLGTYKRAIRDMKRQIVADEPSLSSLQRHFNTLAFMEDTGGSISLAAKAWPYVYPLLVIANKKIPEE